MENETRGLHKMIWGRLEELLSAGIAGMTEENDEQPRSG
jgi:hypothetical protein